MWKSWPLAVLPFSRNKAISSLCSNMRRKTSPIITTDHPSETGVHWIQSQLPHTTLTILEFVALPRIWLTILTTSEKTRLGGSVFIVKAYRWIIVCQYGMGSNMLHERSEPRSTAHHWWRAISANNFPQFSSFSMMNFPNTVKMSSPSVMVVSGSEKRQSCFRESPFMYRTYTSNYHKIVLYQKLLGVARKLKKICLRIDYMVKILKRSQDMVYGSF